MTLKNAQMMMLLHGPLCATFYGPHCMTLNTNDCITLGSTSHPGHQEKPQETETTLSRHTGHCEHFEQRHCPHYGTRQHLSSRAPEENTED
ncbi:UNVERIFIED_CONTAM: hypothetical protein K2H54_058381 [Gekko kuhli]